MIGEAIGKVGEPGTGGGREAFKRGVNYVCSKASRVELLNLTSSDWREAGAEMELTSELSGRVQKPYYHLVLSWHPHERPSLDQQFAAMHHVIEALGLGEHQIVIGSHGDRDHCHIHAIINTVHPTNAKTWSKSNDHMKIEKACREIELAQGWAHDRGRFDFDVIERNGQQIVKLKPNTTVWERKTQSREAGKRQPSAGDIAFEKQHGFPSFAQDIPPALRAKFGKAVEAATGWRNLHDSLADLGLQYLKSGSGARVRLLGSKEDAKASAFGQKFSMKKLEARFGPYLPPEPSIRPPIDDAPGYCQKITGQISEESKKRTKSRSFQLTLLRRIYTGLHFDDHIAQQIRYVCLDRPPPTISFKDGGEIVDNDDQLATNNSTDVIVTAMIKIARAKGWSTVRPTGSPDFVKKAAMAAARAGLGVSDVPEDIQSLADEILEQTRKRQSRLDQAAEASRSAHLDSAVDRAVEVEKNRSAEARMAAKAILGTHSDGAAGDEHHRQGRPPVPKPQLAPDAAKTDRTGARRVQRQIRDTDLAEIEDMKCIDISIIAALGEWTDVSRIHPDSHDPRGTEYRIFQKDTDTIKASRVDGKWLWTSNKTGKQGSAIDLWLHDNPGRTLGHARIACRELIGAAPFPVLDRQARAAYNPPDDHTEARKRWDEAEHITKTASNYATQRGIAPVTMSRFREEVRTGAFGGIYFAHRNPETGGILGFEQRWQRDGKPNTARFAKGGRKTVNVLGDIEAAKRMVVVEGGLDALAIAELEAREDTIYVSTAGGFGQLTEEALLLLAQGREVISAFDNDTAGDALHVKLFQFLPQARREKPPSLIEGANTACKDWLDVLNASREALQTEHTIGPQYGAPGNPVDETGGKPHDPEKQDLKRTLLTQSEDDTGGPGFP